MGFWWVVVTGHSSGRQCGDLCVELLDILVSTLKTGTV